MTPTAQYRLVCMKLLYARAAYYCSGITTMDDFAYDTMETKLTNMERQFPHLRHPLSPTGLVGSSSLSDYPRSIQRAVDELTGDPRPHHAYRRPKMKDALPVLVEAHKRITGQTMAPANLQMLIDEKMIDAKGQPL